MNYQQRLQESKNKAAEQLLGTKIRDLMKNMRNGNTENAARRWLWELIQNAKDVAFEDTPVKVQVELHTVDQQKVFTFRHNGQPFTIDNITFLIEQVSTKDQEVTVLQTKKKKKTGKFGTGFLSTHLLSDVVRVNGVLKDEDLPYRRFEVLLDRSPEDIPGIITSVNHSLESVFKDIEHGQVFHDFDKAIFNTGFTYVLEPEKEEMAQVGVADLHHNLPFTMAFSDDVAEVEVVHDYTTYQVVGRQILAGSRLEMVTIKEASIFENVDRKIVIVRGDLAAVAAELELTEQGIYRFKRRENTIPHLFCDFPLIGSEIFPFPVIINSPQFNPVEPRNGVWLTGKDTSDVTQNEQIIAEAITLYQMMLTHASANGWLHLFEMARIQPAPNTNWLSASWFEQKVLHPVRNVLLAVPLVDTISKRVPILGKDATSPTVWFPDHEHLDIRMKIWQLGRKWIPNKLPLENEVISWSEVIWDQCSKLTLATLANTIQENGKMSALMNKFNLSEPELILWLNEFFQVIAMDAAFEDKIISGTHRLIPNQEGTFKKREELLLDKQRQIEDPFKRAVRMLGSNLWEQLIDPRIVTGNRITYKVHSLQSVLDDINVRLKNTQIAIENRQAAAAYLTTFTNAETENDQVRTAIHKFNSLLFEGGKSPQQRIQAHNTDIWKEADIIHIKVIVKMVAQFGNVDGFKNGVKLHDSTSTIAWLNYLVWLLQETELQSQLNLEKSPILPNQHGEFYKIDWLYLDKTSYNELKEIMALLGHDYRDELLDKGISLPLPENRQINDEQMAAWIIEAARPHFSTITRSDNVKDAFRKLVHFFSKHADESERLFKDLYLNKHKLYDDTEIVSNFEKIAVVNSIMQDFGIETIEDLRTILQRGASLQVGSSENVQDDDGEFKKVITKELLASWGISTEAEYRALVGSDVNNAIFKHYSKPDPILFQFSQVIIARAQKNILAHLQTLPLYDCTGWEPLATTVIGGIKKAGRRINVVFRPSDGHEVIFYYQAEFIALDEDNTELWVDNGKSVPIFLTLGKILKGTGINRIPIGGITTAI